MIIVRVALTTDPEITRPATAGLTSGIAFSTNADHLRQRPSRAARGEEEMDNSVDIELTQYLGMISIDNRGVNPNDIIDEEDFKAGRSAHTGSVFDSDDVILKDSSDY